jgi:hypothetical protein
MSIFKALVKTTITLAISLSLLACGGSDAPSILTPQKTAEVPPPAPVPEVKVQLLFEEDIAEDIRQSTPDDINLPLGLDAVFDIEYKGAFRVEADGDSTSDYAVGALGFNPDNHSVFMAGHAHHNAIAEFQIPSKLSFATSAQDIVEAPVLQSYVKILGKKDVGNKTDKINGMLYFQDNLLVTSEIWYDGSGNNQDNLQVFSNAHDLRTSGYKGMLQIQGAAKSAGYMFKVPNELTEKIGAKYITGWASNYAITSRYSQGPSLYRFDPSQATNAVLTVDRAVKANPLMVFPFSDGKQLVEGGDKYGANISPVWGPLARAKYGFIVPGTAYFLAIGQNSGLHSGVGYKITQDNGRSCAGPCAYKSKDIYNYFWLFDINSILEADEPWNARPISYGKWSHPYDKSGMGGVIGATFDDQESTLYMAINGAGKIREYDNPPLIIGYQIKNKTAKPG